MSNFNLKDKMNIWHEKSKLELLQINLKNPVLDEEIEGFGNYKQGYELIIKYFQT
jgi:hypothetical protein